MEDMKASLARFQKQNTALKKEAEEKALEKAELEADLESTEARLLAVNEKLMAAEKELAIKVAEVQRIPAVEAALRTTKQHLAALEEELAAAKSLASNAALASAKAQAVGPVVEAVRAVLAGHVATLTQQLGAMEKDVNSKFEALQVASPAAVSVAVPATPVVTEEQSVTQVISAKVHLNPLKAFSFAAGPVELLTSDGMDIRIIVGDSEDEDEDDVNQLITLAVKAGATYIKTADAVPLRAYLTACKAKEGDKLVITKLSHAAFRLVLA